MLEVYSIKCTEGKKLVRAAKKNVSWNCDGEELQIWGNGQMLYSTLCNLYDGVDVYEMCLTITPNLQYQIKLVELMGATWDAGAWVYVEGDYGNKVFKSFMSKSSNEVYDFSLYNGVIKNDLWRITSGSITGSWTEYDYYDSSWTPVILGEVTASVSGTQYFRKNFTSLMNMAAYELSMNYRYGIIAYINGTEIYRDNMPDGSVSSTTLASGSYATIGYRSVIRPGN